VTWSDSSSAGLNNMTFGVLDVHVADLGGHMSSEVTVHVRPAPADVWLVFVHGFNVDAAKSATQLRWLREHESTSIVAPSGTTAWVLVRWPSALSGSSLLNKITYPKVLEKVAPVGNALGDHLAGAPVDRVVFVGHSLGAQVALHAVNRMRINGRRPDGIALLAGAVQTSDLEREGGFGVPLACEAVTVNPRDSVLRRVFEAGERAATPLWATTPAVGLTGNPLARGWTRIDLVGKDHDVYRDGAAMTAVAAAAALPMRPMARTVPGEVVEGRTVSRW
jgi:pimeloyl-ACP methyl ester carboxylesterase